MEFKFKKALGQNFISDANLIKKIVDVADINKESLVIEIGPGAGSLTLEILKRAGFAIIYEIDKTLEPILNSKLEGYNNYELIFEDFLKADIAEKIKKYNYKEILVVANLPYYITTPIIKKIVSCNIIINRITIMVQEEVANRFSAKVNSKDYGSLTVFLNYYYDIENKFKVDKKMFYPVPKVDSSVILLKRKDKLLPVKDINEFQKIVNDSFKFKRKTLRNNLKDYDLEVVSKILNKYHLDLTSRAENVPLEAFIDITNSL